MRKYCDLHTHSYFSDGTISPTQLVKLAEENCLASVVLCDHNTVAGLDEFMKAGEGKEVVTVPGVEFSTDYGDIELHIIGMFIDKKYYEDITNRMQKVQDAKEKSNINLIKRLSDAGYDISYEKIKNSTYTGKINRAHVAAELVNKGYASSVSDAFERFLKRSVGYYIPPKRPDSFETIKYIKSIGGLSVLAHPFLNLKTEVEIRTFVTKAKEYGLDGIEVVYSLFSKEETCIMMNIARDYDLIFSGGSDYHGANKPHIQIGIGKGNLSIPNEFYIALKSSHDRLIGNDK